MKRTIVTFLYCLCLFSTTQAQTGFANLQNTSFQDGEKLTFRVYYNMGIIWINAGNAVFTVQPDMLDGKKTYHIVGDGKTAKNYEWVFKVDDKYQTYLDRETMLPIRFIRNVYEGGVVINNDVTFNRPKAQAYSDNQTFTVPEGTQDVLSSIYYARNINYDAYKPGDHIPFYMFLDNQVYNISITYMGKERIKTKMGTFNTIKINPQLISGTIFKDGDKMTVWVTDDANHLPVRIESPILVGSIKVDLMEYEGIRNPMTGMISKND